VAFRRIDWEENKTVFSDKTFLLRFLCLLLLVWLFFVPHTVTADVKYIDLTNPFLRKIPMAVPVFRAMTPIAAETAMVASVADQISNMLDFTGYFKMLDRGAFLYNPQTSGITAPDINFANWTTVGAELLITGGVLYEGNDLVLEMRLFDTVKSQMVLGKRYRGGVADARDILRRYCSEVMMALTGRPGMFDSRLAFVSTGSGNKEIYSCEFDGANVRQITKKGSITSFPAWSSDGRFMAYTSFINGPAQVFIRNMATGQENHLTFKGVQIAPAWAPQRFELSATLSFNGDQEIYLLTGGGKMIKRLTNSRGIDVDATWSPKGDMIAFVSDRAGTPQIYVQETATERIRRLTFDGQYNTQPNWSPLGDKIAYSSMQEGQLNIFVIDSEGLRPVQLTRNQGDNEAPSWSPDGSLIAFSSTREGKSQIYVMTAFGTDQRRLLSLPGAQTHPKWSSNVTP
jgi:TolB protein